MEFVVVGEALVDVVPDAGGEHRDLPGGSPANVAITLARLGRAVRLVTTLGGDERGGLVHRWLTESGVEVDASEPATGRTSSAVVTLDASGAASYDFDLTWDLADVDAAGADVLHVGSVATVLEPGAEVVRRAVVAAREHAVVSFDPNARPALTADRGAAVARVEELVSHADVVKVSDEDLAFYHPGDDPVAVAARWVDSGPGLVVVTRGQHGAVATRRGGHRIDVPGIEVTVSDTVGAGDTFSGVLLDALGALGVHGRAGGRLLEELSDRAVAGAVQAAAAGAAVTVSRPGADPPDRAELDAVLGRSPGTSSGASSGTE